MKRVVITGIGSVTSIANNVKDFWLALLNGRNGVGPITHFDASKFKTQFACEVKNLDPLNYFERSELKKYDSYLQFSLIAAQEAVANANINFEKLNKNRSGVIW